MGIARAVVATFGWLRSFLTILRLPVLRRTFVATSWRISWKQKSFHLGSRFHTPPFCLRAIEPHRIALASHAAVVGTLANVGEDELGMVSLALIPDRRRRRDLLPHLLVVTICFSQDGCPLDCVPLRRRTVEACNSTTACNSRGLRHRRYRLLCCRIPGPVPPASRASDRASAGSRGRGYFHVRMARVKIALSTTVVVRLTVELETRGTDCSSRPFFPCRITCAGGAGASAHWAPGDGEAAGCQPTLVDRLRVGPARRLAGASVCSTPPPTSPRECLASVLDTPGCASRQQLPA